MQIAPKDWYLLEEYYGWPLCALDDFIFARTNHFSKLVGTDLDSILVIRQSVAYMFIQKRKWRTYKNYFSKLVKDNAGYFEKIYAQSAGQIKVWRALNKKILAMSKASRFDLKLFNSWRAALVDVALVGQPINFVEFGKPALTNYLKKYLSTILLPSEVEGAFIRLTDPFHIKADTNYMRTIKVRKKYDRLFTLVRTVILSKDERYKIFDLYKSVLIPLLRCKINKPITGKYALMTIDEIIGSSHILGATVRRHGIAYINGKRRDIDLGTTNDLIKVSETEAKSRIREIKGQCAMPGKARGKVTVLLVASDLRRMKKGNIVVAHTTTVDLLPAMKVAAGIVTDMGGITSHAAIVARELKKPCVIGAQFATKILKDGDVVEVNANHGVVTLIKRK